MKERLSRKKLSVPVGILVVLALFVGILLMSAVIFVLTDALGLRLYYQYVVFALLIVIGIAIVRKWLTEYEYAVVDDELIIDRFIGSRPKNLFRIRLNRVVSISQDKPSCSKKQRLTYHPESHGVTYIVYLQDGEERCLYFSPSEAMRTLIDQRRSGASNQQ